MFGASQGCRAALQFVKGEHHQRLDFSLMVLSLRARDKFQIFVLVQSGSRDNSAGRIDHVPHHNCASPHSLSITKHRLNFGRIPVKKDTITFPNLLARRVS